MHCRLLLASGTLFASILLAPAPLFAANAHGAKPQSSESANRSTAATSSAAALRVDTTLVLIPCTVTDTSNRFVLGLDRGNFSVFEDGVQQKLAVISGEDAPLSIGILLDTSGSMGMKLATSRRAVAEFLKTMNSSDEAFLVEFSEKAQLTVPFTQDADKIDDRLRSAEPGGLTALLDAVYLALREMKSAKNPRKAILIVSDGGDNHSRYTAADITNLVRNADVQIYAMGVFEPLLFAGMSAEELSGPHLLSEIAEQTGGRAYPARSSDALPGIARRIGIELRNEYVLAYSPSNADRNGKYRKVDVKLNASEGLPALKARWRLGYYAPTR
jgi:Ca-activated chloride channel family protein